MRVPNRQGVAQGQVKVTVRLTFPDKSDAWQQQTVLMDEAPISAARQAAALMQSWQTVLLDTTDWNAIIEGTE